MSHSVLIGYFDDEEKVLDATRAAHLAGYKVHDVYTPYAVHGMDEAMGLRPSRLTWVCFAAGLFGGLLALLLELHASTGSWSLDVRTLPFAALPAFLPVAFETTVLFAGLLTVVGLLVRCQLFPGSRRQALPRVTDDRFALVLGMREEPMVFVAAEGMLRRHGAVEMAWKQGAPALQSRKKSGSG